ncbi:hypothetical protein MRX96_059472 [Rhipicephalus microplus]
METTRQTLSLLADPSYKPEHGVRTRAASRQVKRKRTTHSLGRSGVKCVSSRTRTVAGTGDREEIRIGNNHSDRLGRRHLPGRRTRRFRVTSPTSRVDDSIPLPRRERPVTTTSPSSKVNGSSAVTSNGRPFVTLHVVVCGARSRGLARLGVRSTVFPTCPSDGKRCLSRLSGVLEASFFFVRLRYR